MAKTQVRKFDSQLAKLFSDRTHWLKSLIRKKVRGKAPHFNRNKVEIGIRTLQKNATEALLHSRLVPSISDLCDQKAQWHPKMGNGRGVKAKIARFKQWYDTKITSAHCVYLFWNNRTCLYIGRTLNGKGRPLSHFEKKWFDKATRLDILAFRTKRDVAMSECLATHKFKPKHSSIKPSRKKWFTRCPICEVNNHIRAEVKQIFRLK